MLNEREKKELRMQLKKIDRQNRFRMMSGMMNFVGVILGILCILLLLALIFSIINWLTGDIAGTFLIFESKLR